MSGELGSETDVRRMRWGSGPSGLRGLVGLGVRRRPTPLQITEARGPAACMRRDALFRRTLLVADTVAIVGAFVLTVALASRSLQLTWAGIVGVPILLVGAKLFGLYDRDETLLRKTTLDEAPKLFQAATLCALVAWLMGGLIVSGELNRHEALFLWLTLAGLLMLARTMARAIALRIAPVERCLFIGDETSANAIRSKLTEHGGVRAKMVAHLNLDKAAPGRRTASRRRGCRRSATSHGRSTCIVRSSRRAAPTRARCSISCARSRRSA
jgi:hypothetical protein